MGRAWCSELFPGQQAPPTVTSFQNHKNSPQTFHSAFRLFQLAASLPSQHSLGITGKLKISAVYISYRLVLVYQTWESKFTHIHSTGYMWKHNTQTINQCAGQWVCSWEATFRFQTLLDVCASGTQEHSTEPTHSSHIPHPVQASLNWHKHLPLSITPGLSFHQAMEFL